MPTARQYLCTVEYKMVVEEGSGQWRRERTREDGGGRVAVVIVEAGRNYEWLRKGCEGLGS